LYPTIGGANKQAVSQDSNGSTGFEIDSVMWTLFLADGEHDLISIAEKTGSTFSDIVSIVDSLERTGLVTLA
jgi:aminopeptidase-like protein